MSETETPLSIVIAAALAHAEYGGVEHEDEARIKLAAQALSSGPDDAYEMAGRILDGSLDIRDALASLSPSTGEATVRAAILAYRDAHDAAAAGPHASLSPRAKRTRDYWAAFAKLIAIADETNDAT